MEADSCDEETTVTEKSTEAERCHERYYNNKKSWIERKRNNKIKKVIECLHWSDIIEVGQNGHRVQEMY